ncbi:nucleoside triphosphate pyrophosphohydrolase family protein [Candidatus Woesebacteria bacterium]|nr:nucleoside triphosphate pyrophosphohydrolase family protein [Candidatus Woesebacteria bacterium]
MLEFHRLAKSSLVETPTANISPETKALRIRLIREETEELIEAIEQKSLREIAKELADVLYVLLGTVIAFGLHSVFEKVFTAVHNSNLSKFGEDKNSNSITFQGKVMKGKRFKPADLSFLPEE